MSTASHGGSGSATITFRKLIDSGVLHTEALNEILSYPIDVDWVDAYMSKKSSEGVVWSSCGPGGSCFAQRFLDALTDILAAPEGYCSISRMLNALDTLGAVVRAAVRRPSPDGSLGIIRVICGPTLEDGPLLRLIHTLTGVMSSKDRMPPVVKASALSALALLACASPHIHQNVCVDYLCASSSVVYRALVDILREPSLSRTVGADAVVLLVILCAYQRGERRNPFVQRLRGAGYEGVHGRPYHADVITEPESPPSHPSRSPSLAFSGSGDEFKSHVHTPHEDSRPPTPSVASSAPPHTLFAASLAKPLHTLAAAVNANICAGATMRLMTAMDGTAAPATAAHVTTAASLVRPPGSGLFSLVSSFASAVVTTLTGIAPPPAVVTPPPVEPLRCPLRLSTSTRVTVLLLAFQDIAFGTSESVWLSAGGPTWRGHGGGAPVPSCAPELLRQVLSLCAYGVQANEKDLPKLALLTLLRLTQLPAPKHHADGETRPSDEYSRAFHALMFSPALDADSTTLTLYERGGEGGVVAITAHARPLCVAAVRIACHGINVRLKGKLNTQVLLRALRVLHVVMFHTIHHGEGEEKATSGGRGGDARASGAMDWTACVRCIIALCKRLCSLTEDASSAANDEVKAVVFETARVLDLCVSGLSGPSRLSCYYEFTRERHILDGVKTLLLHVFTPHDLPMPASTHTLPRAALERLLSTLPPRISVAVRNLHTVVHQLTEQMATASAALTASDDAILSEEDVIQMVTNASPWKHVHPAERGLDSYTPYAEGNPLDAALLGGLARSVVEDCRVALQLA